MKSILIAFPMIMFTLGASAQTLLTTPKLPTENNLPMVTPRTMPQSTTPSGTSIPGAAQTSSPLPMANPSAAPASGTSIPGAAQSSNAIDQAKTEVECKIPTNATKPECIELMLKK